MGDDREFSLDLPQKKTKAATKTSLAAKAKKSADAKSAAPKLATQTKKKMSRSNYVERDDKEKKRGLGELTENLGSKVQMILFFFVLGVIGWFCYPIVMEILKLEK